MRLNHALGLWVYFTFKKKKKKHHGQLGQENLGKWFLKNHPHLGELNSEKNQLLRFVFLSFFATFKITPRMIKMLYLHILQADSTEN